MASVGLPSVKSPSANVIWKPTPGSQFVFLSCPFREALYDGTRGPGKTDALLMDFAEHVGLGFGANWRGILFRQPDKILNGMTIKGGTRVSIHGHWTAADKSPGTRKQGWEQMRALLKASTEAPMEEPGMFIFDPCRQWIRTVPVLRRDEDDPDDVDTEAEDHCADETRHRLLRKRSEVRVGKITGV